MESRSAASAAGPAGWRERIARASRRLQARTGGISGNERLTGATAVVLLAMLAAEGITIVFIGQLLGEHIFIGIALIPPVLLKLGSTGYRFVRYYTKNPTYRERGHRRWSSVPRRRSRWPSPSWCSPAESRC